MAKSQLRKCSVNGCSSNGMTEDGLSYHKFPPNAVLREFWIVLSGASKGFICSKHFEKQYFTKKSKKKRMLFRDAVPTIFKHRKITVDLENPKCNTVMGASTMLDDETNIEKVPGSAMMNGDPNIKTIPSTTIKDKSSIFFDELNNESVPNGVTSVQKLIKARMPKNEGLKRVSKKHNKPFKFDMDKILKERRDSAALKSELCIESKESDEEMKILDELFRAAVKDMEDDENTNNDTKLDHFVFDNSTFNIPHDDNSFSDIATSCSHRFLIISIEQNELQAFIHYNHLIKTGWSPKLNDVQNAFRNWNVDLENLIYKSHPEPKSHLKAEHNIELLLDFIIQSILKNNKFSDYDLLKLAKFAIVMYLDHNNVQYNKNIIKRLFSTCIKIALHEDNETDILMFAYEICSKYEDHLLKMTAELFLPLDGQVMKILYTFLTFKLYKSLLGQPNCIIECPSNINEWFVQDLVNTNYFRQNPKILGSVIQLLEHVVIIFDLYKDEEKLRDMYDFLHYGIKQLPIQSSEYQNLLSLLDHWNLELFRLHVNRNINTVNNDSNSF